jgi:PAS domain S-box-containing protein
MLEMSENLPLYNSRVYRIYLEYLRHNYPDIDINFILEYACMTKDEIADQAHWFTQFQADRFQEISAKLTGNRNIAREAARFGFETKEAIGVVRHYLLGLLDLSSIYLLISKVYAVFSRAVNIEAKKAGYNKVEIICTPIPGIIEKSYQCESRIGFFETVAKLFTSKFADIEHVACFHKGNKSCRYIISWEKSIFVKWQKIRNYLSLIIIPASLSLFLILSPKEGAIAFLCALCITMIFSFIPNYYEKKELTEKVKTQGDIAKNLLDEMNMRHNNALLIQEIGKAISSILNIDKLINVVINSMKTHMDFDRGLIMLANENKTELVYKNAYGYMTEKEELLRHASFNLSNPSSRGAFVVAYKEQKPFLINDFKNIEEKLSSRSLDFAKEMNIQSMICAPIVYENESLGILAVDNIQSKRPLTKSDMSVIEGVASQMAISINNVISYQKLHESEKKYRDLVENANSIIMRRDVTGRITFFNEFAQNFFNCKENEILDKNFEDTMFQDSRSARNEFNRIVHSLKFNPEKQIINENESILKDGTKIWITWTYKPIFDSSGQLMEMLCIGNDITELKTAELEKNELEVSLQRARKMEALGTLAGGVAHDLNNILSGIVSYPELLLMDLPPESRLRKPISTIQKAGERAAAIVQDLLTLARRGVVSRKTVDLNSIIMEYLQSPECESLKEIYPSVKIKHELNNKILKVLGSPVHLNKTIMNLVNNAVEAIQNKGDVLIKTENKYVDRTINGFDKVEEGDYVIFSISDNGIGISPKDLERIFEPFYTKKVMGKSGTGLGMAVVWGTIKDHNGYIDIKSKEGIGTVFKLYFPATRQKISETEPQVSIHDLKGNGETILVVDDVEEQREIALEMLKKLNYHALAVSNGEDAVRHLKTHPVDLLILDMILEGGIDGLDTFKKILEFKPRQKAVIASGYSETVRVKEAQALGAGRYLKKPYLLDAIAKAINEELSNN